ncbi:hypothetical protein [Enterobacter sichuanensis]|uniref:hypothetical protein n=2 Tax=Enterobacter sichuanensis TaxID=2071710 RepID=UPI002075E229|nr:hypothetical protein [Enterobacter sichuanensis]MCM7885231.1 hypothetical protein [Enterobacter sichuanensis]
MMKKPSYYAGFFVFSHYWFNTVYFRLIREDVMAISEKDLLEAGFSQSEVDNLQARLSAAGGTLQHLIDALSRRFQVSVWLTVALVLVMLVILIAGSRTHILSGSMSFLIILIIAWVTFPPALGWKAFRLQRTLTRKAR